MEKSKKNRGIMITGIIAAMMLISGTFAWTAFSQRALNENEGKNANMGGRIHDDYHKKSGNKDIYAENFGKKDLLVRIKLSEYFEGNGEPLVGKTSKDDRASWIPYSLPVKELADDPYRAYVNWELGGDKVFLPTFNMDNQSLETDAAGDAIDFIVNGPTNLVLNEKGQLNDGTQDFFIEGEAYTNPDDSNSTQTAKKTLPGTQKPISMDDWLNLDEAGKIGNYWVIDTDGWAYWAQLLEPEESTSLLLNQLNYEEEALYDFDSWYYGIDVIGEFTTVEDADKFKDSDHGPASSDAQSLINRLWLMNSDFVDSIEFMDKVDGRKLGPSETLELKARLQYFTDPSGTTAYSNDIKWSSSNPKIASIDNEKQLLVANENIDKVEEVTVTATAVNPLTKKEITNDFIVTIKPVNLNKETIGAEFDFFGEKYIHLQETENNDGHLIVRKYLLPDKATTSKLDEALKNYYDSLTDHAKEMVEPIQTKFELGKGDSKYFGLDDSGFAVEKPNDDYARVDFNGTKKAFVLSLAEMGKAVETSGGPHTDRKDRAASIEGEDQTAISYWLRTPVTNEKTFYIDGAGKYLGKILETSNTSNFGVRPALVIK
ncbi:DUF6273 domain-containing protein [Enterococcus rivorum]|uniref:DUF6273 domain-containing protein n=1 Tax=Enterococcus rivorum TaxID=762845 RepID=A0A1E5KTT8_9ENTE|nr:DUF6273 domain-containing protein [Enterococcus rivorum]OEH81307.1 hypothetical protein BCR26_17190 [Enterococcus rivorum]